MENSNYILGEKEKERISVLVKKAMGERTGAEFADLIGLSPSLFSNLLKGKYRKRLPLELLIKIDENKGDPSDSSLLDELCSLNGHSHFISDRTHSLRQARFMNRRRALTNLIISSIINSGLMVERKNQIEVKGNADNLFYSCIQPDFSLRVITEGCERYWAFILLPTSIEPSDGNIRRTVYSRISSQVSTFLLQETKCPELFSNTKVSFAFVDQNIFSDFMDYYKDIAKLPVETSAMLFDAKNCTFVKEEFLQGNFKITEELKIVPNNDISVTEFDNILF